MWKRIVVGVLALVMLGLVGAQPLAQQAKLLIWADDTRTPVLRDVADGFTATTGVEVEVVEIAFADLRAQFVTAAQAGEAPDILIGAHDWVGELAANGFIETMDLGDLADQFNPAALEGFSYGGDLYGLPYSTENVALIYNKDMVSTPPATWSELMSMAADMTDVEAGKYGYTVQNPDPFHWFPMLSACGGYVFGKTEDGALNPNDVGLANEGAVHGAQLFDQMVEQNLLAANVDWDTMTSLMSSGNSAMVISGPWLLGILKDAGINYGVAPIPDIACADGTMGTPKPFLAVQGFMISSQSENKVLAQDFLFNYIATEETMLALFNRQPRPPAFLPALNTVTVQTNADVQAFGEQAQSAIPMPNIPAMNSVWAAWSSAQELIANQEQGPAEALQDAVEQIKAAISGE